MIKLIRSSTFETNSSSCHSLTLIDNTIPERVRERTYIVSGGEYGWDLSELRTTQKKLDYICQSLYIIDEDKLNNFKDYLFNMFNIILDIDYNSLEEGYVDHQSIDILPINSNSSLAAIIFNNSNYITTDNDNY